MSQLGYVAHTKNLKTRSPPSIHVCDMSDISTMQAAVLCPLSSRLSLFFYWTPNMYNMFKGVIRYSCWIRLDNRIYPIIMLAHVRRYDRGRYLLRLNVLYYFSYLPVTHSNKRRSHHPLHTDAIIITQSIKTVPQRVVFLCGVEK